MERNSEVASAAKPGLSKEPFQNKIIVMLKKEFRRNVVYKRLHLPQQKKINITQLIELNWIDSNLN